MHSERRNWEDEYMIHEGPSRFRWQDGEEDLGLQDGSWAVGPELTTIALILSLQIQKT